MQRKPTMNDVARLAGVGTMTVSRVLNSSPHVSDETAARVRTAVARLGYQPNEMARALRNFKSSTIGLLLPNLYDPFYATCAHALNMVAKEHDYTVLLTITNDNADHEYVEAKRMLQRHVEGLVVIPAESDRCRLGDPEFSEIPVVSMDRPLPPIEGREMDSVTTENQTGAREAIEHLVQVHGLKRILFVGHKPALFTMQERHEGYTSAMSTAGLATMARFDCVSEARATEICRDALELPEPPQAIFTANNLATRLILSALLKLRIRVPEQLALVGFDDLELSDLLHPALTVVRQPMTDLGSTAGRLLFGKLKSQVPRDQLARVVLPVELVVRNSCGCFFASGLGR
ncbi:LacI family DNA-binding transcriptional regulator [Acidipila sp. EB88]|uniref:LacI family DNA-binding transcriptional regulator n=1 Tax=Acidipila sp. EB88 TaxID=2305226 RepID=UPI000F5F4E09|nr:LacI family DNA-binding transcriptional regulator [Acidipila sp. EB88]RRA47858.1 LacI family transcriptional regulator [Acidipila sp. EB88]